MIELLTHELIARGHDVTLFAAPGTESRARVLPVLEQPHPDEILVSQYEADHAASAFDGIDEAAAAGRPFDIVHDHSGFTAFAFARRLSTPLVHTLHGPFDDDTRPFYNRHRHKAPVVAISRYQAACAPDGLRVAAVIPNPLAVEEFPLVERKSDYLLWMGRMNDDKGPQRAISAARRAGRPIVLAGPVQRGQEEFFAGEVEPHLDNDGVHYAGEVGGEQKARLFGEASALLMPIRWPEPFGLVMTEAMACGTPVIAFPEGSAPEIVDDGETGFLVDDEEEMAAAVGRLSRIDPARCREVVQERFDVGPVTDAYESAYRAVSAAFER